MENWWIIDPNQSPLKRIFLVKKGLLSSWFGIFWELYPSIILSFPLLIESISHCYQFKSLKNKLENAFEKGDLTPLRTFYYRGNWDLVEWWKSK